VISVVQGNYIGTDATGLLARGNKSDIAIYAVSDSETSVFEDNLISANTTKGLDANVIGYNHGQGIFIDGADTHATLINNTVVHNAEHGVYVSGSATAKLTSNHITTNTKNGVQLLGSAVMRGNSIFANGWLGIDYAQTVGVIANDATESDGVPVSLSDRRRSTGVPQVRLPMQWRHPTPPRAPLRFALVAFRLRRQTSPQPP